MGVLGDLLAWKQKLAQIDFAAPCLLCKWKPKLCFTAMKKVILNFDCLRAEFEAEREKALNVFNKVYQKVEQENDKKAMEILNRV